MIKHFAWKKLSTGKIIQTSVATSKDDLFEMAGFGAVRTDAPIKGFIAVPVIRDGNEWIQEGTQGYIGEQLELEV